MKSHSFFVPKLELRHGLLMLMLVLTACPPQPPGAPVLTTPAANSTTSNNLPSIGGTAVAGNTVNVYELPQPAKTGVRLTPLPPTVCSSVVSADNTWACTPSSAFLNGIHTITANQTDPSSNISPDAQGLSFTVKTISPAPSITAPAANAVLSTSFPNFAGNGVTGSTVSVSENQKTLCTVLVTNNTWACTSSLLMNGVHTVTASQIAPLGETSPASEALTFTVQVVVPAPNVSSPITNSEVLSNTLEFAGTGLAQHTVTILEGSTVICSVMVSNSAWACKPNTLPTDGAHAYTATQTNTDGVSSETTPALQLKLHALPLIGTLSLEWNTSNRATINDSSNTVSFKPLSYSDIDDVAGGFRYLTMTFEVNMLRALSLENLSLQAVNRATSTAGTGIADIRGFPDATNPQGLAITNASVAQSIVPTHGTQLGAKPEPAPNSSDFQAFPSLETQAREQAAKTAKLLGADDHLLEFGYVARTAGAGRNLDGSTKNYISLGFRLPRRFTFALFPSCPNPDGCPKPYTFQINFLVHADITLRVSRGLGETTNAALSRAVALGRLERPTQLILIGADSDTPSDPKINLLRLPSILIGTAPTTFIP
jgi:hypothetical protein